MTRSHELRVPGSVPGPVLRIASALVIAGGAPLLNPYPLWWWVAGVAALVAAIVPWSMAAWIGIACLALGVILTAPSAGRTALAVLLIPVAHVLAAWAWAVPWRSRIRLRVLLPGVRRLLVIQVIAQSVAAVMVMALPPLHGPGFPWLAPLGAAVLAGVSAVALRVSSHPEAGVEPSVGSGAGANVGGRS